MDNKPTAGEGLKAAGAVVKGCWLLAFWVMIMGIGLICLWSVIAK